VSSPATIKTETFSRPAVPAARLIPGLPSGAVSHPRKKPQSVTVDGQFWVGEGLATPQPTQNHAFQIFARAVLPGPFVRGQRWRLAGKVFADFLLVGLSFAVISHLGGPLQSTIHHDFTALLQPLRLPGPGLGLLLLYSVLVTMLGYSDGLYRTDLVHTTREEQIILGKATVWATLLASTTIRQLGISEIPLGVLTAGAVLDCLAMFGWRNCWRMVKARRASRRSGERNVLIVGAGKLGHQVAASLDQNHLYGCNVVGFLDDIEPVGGDVHGGVEDLARIAREEFADEIILAIPHQPDLSRRAIREARRNRLDVKVIPDLFGCEPNAVVLENFGKFPVLTLHEEQIPAVGLFLKRALDVASASAGLVLALPLLAAVALAIKLDSPGPVLYCAPRVGKKGRNFSCYKFRTMIADADRFKERLRVINQREGAFFKLADDPRVTGVGRFLRRYSLDELPQLGNVLTGDMSLVGPRPHPLDDFKRYDLQDLRRLDMTPGITGLWQVTARGDPSFQRNMALDLEYIEQWNLWTDLRILWRTVSVVLAGSGA
jgi:exopolysaccharide biosynthesis polyprenyl glycosylphosphotransferase